MLDSSSWELAGVVAALVLLFMGIKEVLSFNLKSVAWGAILIGIAVGVAEMSGVGDSDAMRTVGTAISFVFGIVAQTITSLAAATGVPIGLLWLAAGALAFFALRSKSSS